MKKGRNNFGYKKYNKYWPKNVLKFVKSRMLFAGLYFLCHILLYQSIIFFFLLLVLRIAGVLLPRANEIGDKLIDFIKANANADSIVFKQPSPGAVWISILTGTWGFWNGKLCSFYFHPTKEHSAITDGKNGKHKSTAEACAWAISCQTRAMFGNKSDYDPKK